MGLHVKACSLLCREADAIESHFFIGYGSALKMLRVRSIDECRLQTYAVVARSTSVDALCFMMRVKGCFTCV